MRRLWQGGRLSGRTIVWALIAAALLDLALCGIGTAVGGYELLAVQRQAQNLSLNGLTSVAPSLRGRLNVAATALALARACWWPWRAPAAALGAAVGPARAVAAVGPLLDLAADGSSAGVSAVDGLLPVLGALHQGHGAGADAGTRLLDGLERGRGALSTALSGVEGAQRDWSALDAATLPTPLRSRLEPLGRRLPTAQEALRAALAAPDLLGATHPRYYLLVPQNPWDLRATGGFVGTTALLRAAGGRLSLTAYQSSDTVDDRRLGYVQPPLPLLVYEHFGNWYYRDANWSPDFPTTAALLRYFYWLGRGRMPDGVVAFDSYLLGPLLQVTGPITVPGIAHPLTAANAVTTLDYYVNYASSGGRTVDKGIAGAAYSAVFHDLSRLPASRLSAAAHALTTALQQRHLMLWVPGGALGAILAHHGWDAAIDPTRGDYVYVVDTNVHYNKINKRIEERAAYHAVVQPDRSLHSTLTISYTNTATLQNIPKPQNNTLYEDFVRIYVPLGSRLLSAHGFTQPWPATRDHGKTVFAGFLRLAGGATTTLTVSYDVPPDALRDAKDYNLVVQKQPGTAAIPLSVEIRAAGPAVRVGSGGVWSWQGKEQTDVRLAAPLAGGQGRPIPLAYSAAAAPVIGPGSAIDPWTALPQWLPRYAPHGG